MHVAAKIIAAAGALALTIVEMGKGEREWGLRDWAKMDGRPCMKSIWYSLTVEENQIVELGLARHGAPFSLLLLFSPC
jgi:hypothetical protein